MPSRTASSKDQSDDPLTRAMAPPENETEIERAERLRAEAEAKRISDLIDEELNRQRQAEKKGPKPVKVLLLGQSESGKSTTLKNFQLRHSPKAFKAERASWRAVIQLNVVRSIRLILDAMEEARASGSPPDTPNDGSAPSSPNMSASDFGRLSPEHLKLRMRLLPLLQIEEVLIRRLTSAGSHEIEATQLPGSFVGKRSGRGKELSVSAGSSWKSAFNKMRLGGGRQSMDSDGIDWDDPQDPGSILQACASDMVQLWRDPTIQTMLRAQKLRLEELPGFFLDSLDRIATQHYVPTDNDILRARIKTLGVTEYRFTMQVGNAISSDWRVYDVGGQRSHRAAWVPFFDDMDAIIFLAPISCFDQVLVEDHSVNRLEDSVLLWKSIVSNKLLAHTDLILFLNKCDVLRAKMASGIRLGKYVISYGDRPNDFEHASEYLRRKFAGIYADQSKNNTSRSFHSHFTSVTDTKTTAVILENVTDTVLRGYLKHSSLI